MSDFGLAVIQRSGANPEKVIYENDLIYKNRVIFQYKFDLMILYKYFSFYFNFRKIFI